MKTKTKVKKPYWEMNTEELAEATKEFDKEIPASKLRPLTKKERERWESLRDSPSVSLYLRSKPKAQVSVELDKNLLEKSAKYASKHKMTLSDVIARSLELTMQFVES